MHGVDMSLLGLRLWVEGSLEVVGGDWGKGWKEGRRGAHTGLWYRARWGRGLRFVGLVRRVPTFCASGVAMVVGAG